METEVKSLTVEQLISGIRDADDRLKASIYCEELILRFKPLIYRAWRRSGLTIELSDFEQDVVLRLFRSLPNLVNPKAFPGYFRQIILTVAAECARKHLRDPPLLPIEETQELTQLITNIDDEILTSIFVHTYLDLLPPQEKRVLVLEFLEGHSTAEIASELQITSGAVRVTKGRALNKLRALILNEAQTMADTSKQ